MENEPFEDVFPIKNGDIPASYVIVYQRVKGTKRYQSTLHLVDGEENPQPIDAPTMPMANRHHTLGPFQTCHWLFWGAQRSVDVPKNTGFPHRELMLFLSHRILNSASFIGIGPFLIGNTRFTPETKPVSL